MAYREFDTPSMSRRALLRGGAWLTAGAALAGAPMGRMAFAREAAADWKNVSAMVQKYVTERKVANMVARRSPFISLAALWHWVERSRPMPTVSIGSIP